MDVFERVSKFFQKGEVVCKTKEDVVEAIKSGRKFTLGKKLTKLDLIKCNVNSFGASALCHSV